jgi:FMN-dependent NADH-azoreductase
LLAIEVSPRHEFSTSRKFTKLFIDQWKTAHPGATVVVRDLIRTPPPFEDLAWIGGACTSRERHSPESAAAIKVSDDLVAEFRAADHIVIGTPMFNFSIPAVLKANIDQIVRVGVTVSPSNVGLLTGKKANIILRAAVISDQVRRSRNTTKQAAISIRVLLGSESPMLKSFLPTARVPASRAKSQ